MKKVINALYRFLPHFTLATALVLITLVIVDSFNRAMSFLDNNLTKAIFIVFLVLVLIQSVANIVLARKNDNKKN